MRHRPKTLSMVSAVALLLAGASTGVAQRTKLPVADPSGAPATSSASSNTTGSTAGKATTATTQTAKPGAGSKSVAGRTAAPVPPAMDISGTYTFLREGEFVQINMEEGGVTGYVSRFGERDSDKDAFLDQFFSKGALAGTHLTFTTKAVHGQWFEFKGESSRGPGKTPQDDGYKVLKGTLTEYSDDANSKISARAREVEFKSLPIGAEEAETTAQNDSSDDTASPEKAAPEKTVPEKTKKQKPKKQEPR